MPPSRRDDLIDAAMQVFHRNGFHASGLESVLTHGGISRMTLYNHFKSKDELIVAALRRRDEIFLGRLTKFVEAQANTPRGRLLAVFDFHEQWFAGKDFCGCMFINASAEFSDPTCAVRKFTAEHKQSVVRFLTDLCRPLGFAEPADVAEQLNILLEGAIVTAQVVGMTPRTAASRAEPARLAKRMAEQIIDTAPRA